MAEALLDGVHVVDAGGEPAAVAGRILADLGARVTKLEPPGGSSLRRTMPFARDVGSLRHAAWDAGKASVVVAGASDPVVDEVLAAADVVLATPGWDGGLTLDRARAPHASWIDITPFGRTGPRAHWRAGDLGILAASANLFLTGDPDRPPVRGAQPVSYAHAGPEIAFAALTALASGRPQHVDVSLQEIVLVANMGAVGRYAREGQRGRRRGANIGRTREIWPCADGFVSFGLRGGAARVASLRTLAGLVHDAGLSTGAFDTIDWSTFDQNTASEDELRTIVEPVAAYFASRTMRELYDIAVETNLMLAPACSPREIFASAQLAARELFSPLGAIDRFPQRFVRIRSADGHVAPAGPRSPAPALGDHPTDPGVSPRAPAGARTPNLEKGARTGAWAGRVIVELGSGAAGPIATRYFAEHGATVIRIESRRRPDFLRTYGASGGSSDPDALDRSGMFDALNVGKRSIALDLKHPEGRALALRLIVEHADAVSENFAPKALPGLGLDYDTVVRDKPDLVMVSACLNGQTGPHRDYPGFGGQGAALSGYNFLTGWPDREPIGPFGTITDSLAPRFVATALAAGLAYRDRTGRGCYLDISQVECALYSLSPWLLDFACNGEIVGRCGNADPYLPDLVPHGVYPSATVDGVDDRWIAVTPTAATDWPALEALVGLTPELTATGARYDRRVRALDDALTAFTRTRPALDAAEALQAVGLAAVPVQDVADAYADPQLAHRGHLVRLVHPVLGPGTYERNGFRLSDAPAGYRRASPTLGQDTAWVLGEVLGLDGHAQRQLARSGVLE